jgi:glutamate dehydrogenase
VVGEGGNLGVTSGAGSNSPWRWRINTDAIDNSAGVDYLGPSRSTSRSPCSRCCRPGSSPDQARRDLLVEMTDDVAELVLADNTAQNRLLGVSRAHAGPMLSVHARQIKQLVESGRLDRALEFLPSPRPDRCQDRHR